MIARTVGRQRHRRYQTVVRRMVFELCSRIHEDCLVVAVGDVEFGHQRGRFPPKYVQRGAPLSDTFELVDTLKTLAVPDPQEVTQLLDRFDRAQTLADSYRILGLGDIELAWFEVKNIGATASDQSRRLRSAAQGRRPQFAEVHSERGRSRVRGSAHPQTVGQGVGRPGPLWCKQEDAQQLASSRGKVDVLAIALNPHAAEGADA